MTLRQKITAILCVAVAVFAVLEFFVLWEVTGAGIEALQRLHPELDVRTGIRDNQVLFWYAFAPTVVTGVLVFVGMAWAVGRSVRKPIARLSDHVAAINRSDDLFVHLSTHRALSHLASPVSDEVGALAGEFNRMMYRIQENIAARDKQEKALQNREARLRAILESAAEGIATVTPDGVLESCNPAMERMFAETAQSMVGAHLEDYIPLYEDDLEGFLRAVSAGAGRELEGRAKDGRVFPLHLGAGEMRLGDERMYTIIVRDVTELRRMHAEVAQKQHLATIGEMGASLAHEIRNPITGISGTLQVLKRKAPPGTEEGEIIDEVLEQVDRINGTVRYLLSFAKPWSPKKQMCTVQRIVEEVAESAARSERFAGVRFVADSNGSLDAPLDASLVQRVLWNLFDNAADAMGNEGEIHWSIASENGLVEIRVRDTGPGISPDAAAKIFRPFYSTKTNGTGLGLAICQRIMESHGGEIFMRNSEAGGAEVVLRIPVESY